MSRHPADRRRFSLLCGALVVLGSLSASRVHAARGAAGEYDLLDHLTPAQQGELHGWGEAGWKGITLLPEQTATLVGKAREAIRGVYALEFDGSTLPAGVKRSPAVALKVIEDFVAQAGPRLRVTSFPSFDMFTRLNFSDGERSLDVSAFQRGERLGSSGIHVKVYRHVDHKEVASRSVSISSSPGRYGHTQVSDDVVVGGRMRKTFFSYKSMIEHPGGWVGHERVAGVRGTKRVVISPDGVQRTVTREELERVWSREHLVAYRLPLRATDPGFVAGMRTVVDLPKHILKQAGVQLVFDKRGRSYVRRAAGFDKALLKEMGVQWVGRAKDGSQRAYLRKQGQPGQRYAHYYR